MSSTTSATPPATPPTAAPPAAGPSDLEISRRSFRTRRARRSTGVALLSTVVFAAAVGGGIVSSPGWPRTRESFFDLPSARTSFVPILSGFWLNIRVLVVAAVLVLVLGVLVALARTLRGSVWTPVRLLATVYTDVFRGMPLLVVLYLIGFGVPGLRLQGVPISPVVLGTAALVLTYGAYVGEVFRAGIEAVHPSQRSAARALGLSHAQSLRLVILPQAVRTVTPPLLNDLVSLQKDVGLISVLGAVDAIRRAQIEVSVLANFTPYVVAGLMFIALAVPTARLADLATARARARQQSGSLL